MPRWWLWLHCWQLCVDPRKPQDGVTNLLTNDQRSELKRRWMPRCHENSRFRKTKLMISDALCEDIGWSSRKKLWCCACLNFGHGFVAGAQYADEIKLLLTSVLNRFTFLHQKMSFSVLSMVESYTHNMPGLSMHSICGALNPSLPTTSPVSWEWRSKDIFFLLT